MNHMIRSQGVSSKINMGTALRSAVNAKKDIFIFIFLLLKMQSSICVYSLAAASFASHVFLRV